LWSGLLVRCCCEGFRAPLREQPFQGEDGAYLARHKITFNETTQLDACFEKEEQREKETNQHSPLASSSRGRLAIL
jgi:hypothetical protein